jgi:hypothetical protein
MRAPVVVPVLVGFVLACPAVALGQDPAPPPAPVPAPAPTPAPAPLPPPAPVAGKLSVQPEKVGGSSSSVLAGNAWRVRGTLVPFVADQRVAVRFYRGNRKIAVKNVRVLPSRTGKSGYFLVSFRARQPGRVTVRASHRATPQLRTAIAKGVSVDVLPLRATAGARGLAVRLLQRRLARLGYVVGVRGLFDDRTARAVMAFRKVVGMARTTVADREVFRRLARGQGAFRVRFPQHGRHVEADISRQVMALIGAGGKVERIYHISSGAPGTPTILGTFHVYSRQLGTNAKGMVHSSYFIRGYAIHGYYVVPPYNASHGCLRVPIPDALSIHDWLRIGTTVDTYR